MFNEIHAHKVLNLLHDRPMAMQELRDVACAEFGVQAKFYTCKLNGLDLDALIAYFGAFRSVISGLSDHPFRFKPITDSAIIRSLLA